jgi:hypothetical protein
MNRRKPLERPLIVVTGIESPDDLTFSNDTGTWNVSKALRHCREGKHGQPFLFDVAGAYEANKGVEVDPAKLASMIADPARLLAAEPVILVIEREAAWLIDGHHRLRALHALGVKDLRGWVIEQPHEPNYRVLYNGQRKLKGMKP